MLRMFAQWLLAVHFGVGMALDNLAEVAVRTPVPEPSGVCLCVVDASQRLAPP